MLSPIGRKPVSARLRTWLSHHIWYTTSCFTGGPVFHVLEVQAGKVVCKALSSFLES